MISYKDMTFCSAKCKTTSCHRNLKSANYGKGPKEEYMLVALSPFHKPDMNGENACTLYTEDTEWDEKRIDIIGQNGNIGYTNEDIFNK